MFEKLKKLGLCMCVIRLLEYIGEGFDCEVLKWKESIQKNGLPSFFLTKVNFFIISVRF